MQISVHLPQDIPEEIAILQALYSPVERAILSDYFGILRPPALQSIQIDQAPSEGGLCVSADSEFALESAVAQIALFDIQERLPQCAIGGEEITLLRKQFDCSHSKTLLFPQFLFTINWADTAPGLSWPESYYAIYIPGFEQFVVTASVDSTDAWGVTDMAIGFFTVALPLKEGALEVVSAWWRKQFREYDQQRWAYVWSTGLIAEGEASACADEIWEVTRSDADEEVFQDD